MHGTTGQTGSSKSVNRIDRQQVVKMWRRKSAESIKAGRQHGLHLTGRIYACSRNACELSPDIALAIPGGSIYAITLGVPGPYLLPIVCCKYSR